MNNCGFCGGPRLNGRPLEKDENGEWQHATGSINPASPATEFACRSCAKEKLS